ncbi:nucleotide-binding protein [Pseudomonas syringae group sp. J309-1]|uniref:nucleotide-binding protein n=1 Tax=Pseudomonas syringae group sp. J309-1 TaxID=3079588 RepID=UPI002910B2F3|nr:nucleotide-binding protein [Pseudomonas syringae group sp. J309-1]MDU8357658.1 nucleotide-binding protein [Pseudomonas syringae group sp. J309-1]
MHADLFKQLNNALLDLQSANLQTFERPLKRMSALLNNPDLESINSSLKAGLDVDEFLEASERTAGSMVGSASLLWPDDPKETIGLTLLLIDKLAADPGFATNFGHNFFYAGNKVIAGIREFTKQLLIPFVRDYKLYVESNGNVEPSLHLPISNKIFIVHGHDNGARETLARFLERIGFEAIILHEQANRGRTVIEKVEAHGDVSFAVVLLTPDDEGRVKGGELEPRARQNVLLELGYFIGRLGRDRVCALKRGALEIPSDFAGVVWEQMDDAGAWKQSLGRELQAAGHVVDWNKVMRQ